MRRKLGIFCVLAVFLTAFIFGSVVALFFTQPTVHAAGQSNGDWAAEGTFQCQKPGSKDTITAYLTYTNSSVNNGNPVTFQCWNIYKLTNGNYQMQLLSTDPTLRNEQCIVTVGGNPTGTYQTNTFASLTCNSPGPNDPDFLLYHDYNQAAGSGAKVGGNAVWTAENPGQLTAGTITVNGYTEKGEVFTQSNINGNVMTLTGTKNADPTNCSGNGNLDIITVGDTNTSYMDATTGTAVIYQYQYNGSSPTCNANPAPINLDDSYSHVCNANGVDCTNSGGTTSNGSSDSCAPGNLLAWILCPVFDLLDNALNALNGIIGSLLYIPVSEIFSSNFQHAFDAFRNSAIALLVIAGLVMVISQASDLEIFSAHTVRKALPRIVMAAIGIALAWPLLQLAVTFFNDMGDWVGRIILFSIGNYSISGGSVIGVITGTIGGAVLAVVAAGYAIISLGLGGSGLLLLSALLVVLVGFLVLALRQIVVLMCILLAPLAIASYVLPGTEKMWKFWKDTLLTTLMMYPIIMAFLAAGAAMAHVALSVSGNPFMGILALLLYITPYVMIPFAFKLAGGLMASAISMVEGTHRKSIEGRLGKKRQEIAAGNWNDFKAGNRFAGNRGLTSRLNTAGGGFGAFLAAKDKRRFLTDRGVRQSALERHNSMVAAEYAKQGGTAATQFNDDMLRAQTWRNASEAEAGLRDMGWNQTRIDTAMAAARAQGGFGVARQTYATQQLAATGTGYKDMDDMLRTVARVSGGNESVINSMIGNMRSTSERAGRNDLKAGYSTMTGIATKMMQAGAARNYDYSDAATGVSMANDVQDSVVEAARGIDNATLLRNKTSSVGNASDALVGSLRRNLDIAADASRSTADRAQASGMAGAVAQKIENMIGAGTFGYGPELNVEKLQLMLHNAHGGGTAYSLTGPNGATVAGGLSEEVQIRTTPPMPATPAVPAGPGQPAQPAQPARPNPNYNPYMARRKSEEAQRGYSNNPNDPRQMPPAPTPGPGGTP